MAAVPERKELRETLMRIQIKSEELGRIKDEISSLRTRRDELREYLSATADAS